MSIAFFLSFLREFSLMSTNVSSSKIDFGIGVDVICVTDTYFCLG